MMMGEFDFDRLRLDRKSFSIHDYDYRYGQYAKPRYVKHPVRPSRPSHVLLPSKLTSCIVDTCSTTSRS